MTVPPLLAAIEKGTAWLENERWEDAAVASQKVKALSHSPAASLVRKEWQRVLKNLRKTTCWQTDLREVIEEACSGGKDLVQVTVALNASPKNILKEIITHVFLGLLETERTLVSRGQFLLGKVWELKELAQHTRKLLQSYSPLPPIETSADFSFLIHFGCLIASDTYTLPEPIQRHTKGNKLTDADLQWGMSLLQRGELSKGVAELATKLLTLTRRFLSCKKVYHLTRKQFILAFNQAVQCFTNHHSARFLSARCTPALLHLVARSAAYLKRLKEALKWTSDPDYPYNTPDLYSLLHTQHYHQKQTLLYEYLWKQQRTSVAQEQLREFRGSKKFAKLSPPTFEDLVWKEKSAQRVAELLAEQTKPRPLLPLSRPSSPPLFVKETEKEDKEPPKTLTPLPHLNAAVEWALGSAERDPFCETERVNRWFTPNAAEECLHFPDRAAKTGQPLYANRSPYARKVIVFVHTIPKSVRSLLAHPSLRKIFSIRTDRGCAMMVEIRKRGDNFGLCGVLELGWSVEEDSYKLYHYMWTPPTHSQILPGQLPFPDKVFIKMRSLFGGEHERHLSGTFQILADHKIAIWDCEQGLWYVVWPSVRDVRTLELDFSNPESMAEGGLWN